MIFSELTDIEIVLVVVSMLLFAAGALFIAWIFISRIVKSFREKRVQQLRKSFRKSLNQIVTRNSTSEEISSAASDFLLQELKEALGNSRFARQVLIDQILEFKKNFTGGAAESLIQLYHELQLSKESIRKLRSFAWYEKAKGIRELGEMKMVEAVGQITAFLDSANSVLREEALLATVRLHDQNPLSFLDHYKADISLWMRINLHRFLQQNHSRNLPVFSRWFNCTNTSVVLFSISMARNFRQIECIPQLVGLLGNPDSKVVGLAIGTLGALEAHETANDIASHGPAYFADPKLSARIARTIGAIGDPAVHGDFLLKYLDHPAYEVRFEAARALRRLGVIGQADAEQRSNISGILRHINETLLQ